MELRESFQEEQILQNKQTVESTGRLPKAVQPESYSSKAIWVHCWDYLYLNYSVIGGSITTLYSFYPHVKL